MFKSPFQNPFQNPFPTEGAADSFRPESIASANIVLEFFDVDTLYQDDSEVTPVTTNGEVIGTVQDKSSAGNDFTQGTTANKPLYTTNLLNGLSGARFDGADDYLGKTMEIVQPRTFFVVLAPVGVATNKYAVAFYSTSGSNAIYRYSGYFGFYGPAPSISIGTYSVGSFGYHGFTQFGTSFVSYKNGEQVTTGNGSPFTSESKAIDIGGLGGAFSARIDVIAMYMFSSVLTTEERANMDAYISVLTGLF